MSRTARSLTGVAAAATAITLVGAGAGAAAGSTQAPHAKSTSSLSVTISKSAFKATPHSLRTGRVNLSLSAKGGEAEFQIAKFAKGYSFKKFLKDYEAANTAPPKQALKALHRAVANSTFYGGLDATPGNKVTGSTVLPKAGSYVIYQDGEKPAHPTTLTVRGPSTKGAKVSTDATVKARSGSRFGGDSQLPATGTLEFKNVSKGSTKSPHFLQLQHVADGTTKKDIEDYFASGSDAPPSFMLDGSANLDVVSPGLSETLDYSLPKGTYAELCFFPDLKTGMPHAAMGMIKIVTLS